MEIKGKLKENKTILKNFSYLSVLQIFTLVSPLITYPYLLRIVGIDLYGVVIFGQTIVSYISLIINFGFNLSASRAIAINKERKEILSEIVSSVFLSKFIIWLISFIAYFIVINSVSFFKNHFLVFFFSFFMTFNELLFPVWFFQGIEKMKYTTLINILVRTMFLISIFIFVKSKSDYFYVPIINSIGYFIGGILSIIIIIKKEKIKFAIQPFKRVYFYFKDSIPLFISITSVQIYQNLNKLIIGTFLGMSEVTIYDLGEKIATFLKLPIGILMQTVFPKISREKNIIFINCIMTIATVTVSIGYLLIFIFSKMIVLFFIGENNHLAVNIIRILSFSAIITSFNTFMASCRLVPFGYQKTYMKIMITNCIFFLICILGLFLFKSINLYTLSLVIVCVELMGFAHLLSANKKVKLI